MHNAVVVEDRFELIGAYICDNVERLVDEWERRSRREGEEAPASSAEAAEASRAELRDHLPAFLRAFGEAMIDGRDGTLWERAAHHGAMRHVQGWGPESTAKDFLLLRRVLIADLRAAVDLSAEEGEELSEGLDEAVAASVRAYVERQEAQQREYAERLKRSNDDLKRFAHVVAHEIRNPLALVLAAVRTVELQLGEQSGVRQPLRAAAQAVVTIKGVTDDLLRYADVEVPHAPPERVDLNEVAAAAAMALEKLAERQGATIDVQPLPEVMAHRSSLLQLFTNLIENGIKYTGEAEPRVSVRAAPDRDEPGLRTVVVEDAGIGIPRDQQERIFEFFGRANPDGAVTGSGIGLAVCRRIAEQHGGRIWVESEVGNGSRFYVALPAPV